MGTCVAERLTETQGLNVGTTAQVHEDVERTRHVSGCYTRGHYMSTSAVSSTSRQFTNFQY